MRIRRRLQPLARSAYRLGEQLKRTSVGEAISLYRHDTKPLRPLDAWRLAHLQRSKLPTRGLVCVRPRALGNEPIYLRRGTSDAGVALQTFVYGLHLPPVALDSVRVVWDAGSNIGLTVAHYACLYPDSRVVGVEPDPDNLALALRNIRPWQDRCTMIECAIWPEDGEVAFELRAGEEFAGRVAESGERRVRSRSLDTLLRDETCVDLLKLDIEGAERLVLRENTEWRTKVRNIVVEVHEPYTVEECETDLRRLGFQPTVNPDFRVSILGTR